MAANSKMHLLPYLPMGIDVHSWRCRRPKTLDLQAKICALVRVYTCLCAGAGCKILTDSCCSFQEMVVDQPVTSGQLMESRPEATWHGCIYGCN
mmetsp:Transcript_79751/g.157988  ORF Transcript_79751/g.157988 Transcript_79751/m.157988 type:complete len:94 (+) Transcript_79751:834-1115(+)